MGWFANVTVKMVTSAIEMQVKIWCCYQYMTIAIRNPDGTPDLSLSLVSDWTCY